MLYLSKSTVGTQFTTAYRGTDKMNRGVVCACWGVVCACLGVVCACRGVVCACLGVVCACRGVDRPCLGVEVLGDGIVGVISSSSVVGLTAQEGALGGGVEQQASLSTRS